MRRDRPPLETGRDPVARRWWAGLVALAGLAWGLDVFALGLPLLGLSLGLPLLALFAVQLLTRWFGANRALAARAAGRAGLFLLLVLASFFTCQASAEQGRDGARRLARALEQYRAGHGAYPQQLGALVPEQIETLPQASWRWGDQPYGYSLGAGGRPWLGWRLHALGGRAEYDFERGRIRYRRVRIPSSDGGKPWSWSESNPS
jgi:hypothetical protein